MGQSSFIKGISETGFSNLNLPSHKNILFPEQFSRLIFRLFTSLTVCTYPDKAPSINFINDVFHPLVDVYRNFSLKQRFPQWIPHKDYITHILHYIKNSFKKSVLDNLQQHSCPNQEAWLMYHNKPAVFAEFAKNCAEYSVMDSNLYGDHQGSSSIRFNKLSDQKFGES
ncbi:hypothetical protein K7432_002648 [Basidiobolus ranarum]|uniref:Uncharacterized protein n=1 Tax=Basidiobolus ranarum TaxID=34480 RepID=A0ABR2X151_9FUNG